MDNLLARKEGEGLSKTKIGAYLFAVGTVMTIAAGVLSGEIDMTTAIEQAWPCIAGLLVVVGFRDAI